jgi:hypothetical protein
VAGYRSDDRNGQRGEDQQISEPGISSHRMRAAKVSPDATPLHFSVKPLRWLKSSRDDLEYLEPFAPLLARKNSSCHQGHPFDSAQGGLRYTKARSRK